MRKGGGGRKRVAWGKQLRKVCAIETLLAQKRQAFENSTDGLVQMESFWFMETGNF